TLAQSAAPSNVYRDTYNRLIHKQQHGADLFLTIDMSVQQTANKYYSDSVISGGNACPPTQTAAGSIIVEDPHTGAILAMVSKATPSRPNLDLNLLVKAESLDPDTRTQGQAYFDAVNHDPQGTERLLNRAAQGQYTPGSTFKTVTLTAALDTGKYALNDERFSEDEAKHFVVPQGETLDWLDFKDFQAVATFPMDLEHGYAYS